MPRIEDRTLADQIHEFLAPIQPEDCRAVNLEILATALIASGPVVHQGHIVSAKAEDDGHAIDFDASRPITQNPPTTLNNEHGVTAEIPAPELTDADLAVQWGLPEASSLPLTPPANGKVE